MNGAYRHSSMITGFLVLVMLVTQLLNGCGGQKNILPDRDAEYKNSRSVERLEVPPDLSELRFDDSMAVPGGETTTAQTYQQGTKSKTPRGAEQVLPTQQGIRVVRAGSQRWLLVEQDAQTLWQRIRAFWERSEIELVKEDAQIGIMETTWIENRKDIPMDPVRKLLKRGLDVLYSAPTRDKFRVRLEVGQDPNATELFVTHRGVREVIQNKTTGTTTWVERPSDPELEAEMLNKMMVFLGMEQARVDAALAQGVEKLARAKLSNQGDSAELVLFDDFPQAWQRAGAALDRIGFSVVDRDRSKGVYYVKYNDAAEQVNKQGMLSKWAFWRGNDKQAKDYQLRLDTTEGLFTAIHVYDSAGEEAQAKVSRQILALLYEQLK